MAFETVGPVHRRALVVGCGMAGCAAAWWLEHEGWEVVLVDKEAEPYPSSYLLQLDAQAVRVLRLMGGQEIIDQVTFAAPAMSVRWGTRRVRELTIDGDGEWRLARRSVLLSRLFAHLPATVQTRLGVGLEALEHRSHDVLARFSDGSTESFDMVVGADGLHSTVRRLTLASQAHSVYLNGLSHVWINADAPLPDGRAVIASREGMLSLIYPFLDTDQTSVMAVVPVPSATTPDEPMLVERVCDMVERLGPDMRAVAVAARKSRDTKLTRFSQVRLPRWYTRRVVLLGDSAHCIDPVSGMGAHASLQGAKTLAESLRDTDDVTAAFARLEAEVRPFAKTAQSITARAVEFSTGVQGRSRVATLAGGAGDLLATIPAALTRFNSRRRAVHRA
ncbi:FAD-dependent oxidoreductase [Planobispora longispora]|uniref:FAD-dependent oxidoreductase n=1 Tax=Planobispora longispora TaxID=28887 RepID=A0A8J3RQS7_9ACTN|nr:NAD(P)/FAD-dependent oxidoreductase [Planobispora longispora]BFE79502.1 FAD-dependent monooxygenase [Planobispora longispora]GIH78177.1 FAD-dependent oxidoreductase [Planobispora longispora]